MARVKHPAEVDILGTLVHRRHPEVGWQWWSLFKSKWCNSGVPPAGGDPIVSWEDTWCEPEET